MRRALAVVLCVSTAGCFQPWSLDNLLYRCGGGCPAALTCDDGVCCLPDGEPVCPTLVPDGGVCANGNPPLPYYADKDGDGYGDPLNSRLACHKPVTEPYVTNADDCDDKSATSHPGGTEVCDGHDNDCNGKIDENQMPLTTYYRDRDGDGYGDPAETLTACMCMVPCVPPGYSDQSGDCAPMDGMRHPFAKERCNNLDDDCNGLTDDGDVLDAGDACSAGGLGLCALGTMQCSAGTFSCQSSHAPSLDVCDDQDNDCDGLTDEQPDCGGPASLTSGSDFTWGAQYVAPALSFTEQTSGCLKDRSGATAQSFVSPTWSGGGMGFHIWWIEAAGNKTWDLSRGPKLTLALDWSVAFPGHPPWESLDQPVVHVCGAGPMTMTRYVHSAGSLLGGSFANPMGSVNALLNLAAPADNGWVIGQSPGLDITKVKRLELLVQATDAGSMTRPTFTITFLPDAGFTP